MGQKKTVIITGANSGLGLETAKKVAVASRDYQVILACRNPAKAASSSAGLPNTRRPTATTVSAASTNASGASTACAFARASRAAICRGVSSASAASTMPDDTTRSGSTPTCRSSARRLGLSDANTSLRNAGTARRRADYLNRNVIRPLVRS